MTHEVTLHDMWWADQVALSCHCGWRATATMGEEARRMAVDHRLASASRRDRMVATARSA